MRSPSRAISATTAASLRQSNPASPATKVRTKSCRMSLISMP